MAGQKHVLLIIVLLDWEGCVPPVGFICEAVVRCWSGRKSEVEGSVPVHCALLSPLTVIVICVLAYCCVPITSSHWGVTSAGRTAIR